MSSIANLSAMTGQGSAERTVSRGDAARVLGLTVKRIDQLRRDGHLKAERNPLTGRVQVDLESLHQLIVARGGVVGPAHRWVHRRTAVGV